MHFSKKPGRLSSTGREILALVSHCLANFQPTLDLFIPNFKLKYQGLEKIEIYCVHTYSHFQLTSNRTYGVFLGHPVDDDLSFGLLSFRHLKVN